MRVRRARADDRARRGDRARRRARRAPARRRRRASACCRADGLSPVSARPGERGARPAGVATRRPGSARADARAGRARPRARARRPASRVAVPLVADDELLGLLVAEGSARRRARACGREPDGGRDQEDPADRAADREEPDQGLLRGARRRTLARRPRGTRSAARVRSRPASRRARRRAGRRRLRAGARESLRPARCSTAARTRSARSSSVPRRRRAAGSSTAPSGARGARRADRDRRVERVPGGGSLRRRASTEAQQALVGTAVLTGTPAVLAYEDLGAYKYLLRVAVDGGVRDATDRRGREARGVRHAARRVSCSPPSRSSCAGAASISATSEALYVHPNTLRQRLRRIAELSGLDLRRDDWLVIEIAVKMVRLRHALGATNSG